MTILSFSQHARARMQQRSLSAWDCEFIAKSGTAIRRDRIQLLDRDVRRETTARTLAIARLARDLKVRSVDRGPADISRHQSRIQALKREIERIEKLRGALIVQVGATVVTCMHPNERSKRRASRHPRLRA